MPDERTPFQNLIRLAIILAPLLIGCLSWLSYYHFVPWAGQFKAAITSSALPLKTAQDTPASDLLRDAESAVMFAVAPLRWVALMMTPTDPDPTASFRQLIALPPDATRAPPHVDPRRLRAIVDRGVVGFAGAPNDGDRARSASLIQAAAL